MSSGTCASCGDAVNGYCFNCMGYVDEGGASFYADTSLIEDDDFEVPEPDFEEPDFEEPDFEEPDFEEPDFEEPDF
jgi:hypothetical protein